MTFATQDYARKIWQEIEDNLADRGCFNGIDNETMTELRRDQVKLIVSILEKH